MSKCNSPTLLGSWRRPISSEVTERSRNKGEKLGISAIINWKFIIYDPGFEEGRWDAENQSWKLSMANHLVAFNEGCRLPSLMEDRPFYEKPRLTNYLHKSLQFGKKIACKIEVTMYHLCCHAGLGKQQPLKLIQYKKFRSKTCKKQWGRQAHCEVKQGSVE